MKVITNSFHSSAAKHAITNATKLSNAELHNSRGYFDWEYDRSKIFDLIGDSHTLSNDLKNYINKKYAKDIEDYNNRQKQACRKIKTDAFEHFCNNKKLDIANEVIFQLGDKDFWDKFRQEKRITRNGKNYVLKDYDDNIKYIMNDIYLKQLFAYENIYRTDKDAILKKIADAYSNATDTLLKFDDEQKNKYDKLVKLKGKKRKDELAKLSEKEREEYAKYFDAVETKTSIEKKKLIERIETNSMSIHVVNMTSHYDEYSPHAHAISVCSTSGYKTGLSSRVAKSVVLNKYTLEVLQDKMRDIAITEMSKYPELFDGYKLKTKEKGRNRDYSKDEYIVNKLKGQQAELEISINELENEKDDKLSELMMLDYEIKDTQAELNRLSSEVQNKTSKSSELDSEIVLKENYKKAVEDDFERQIDRFKTTISDMAKIKIDFDESKLDDIEYINFFLMIINNVPGAFEQFRDLAEDIYEKYKEDLEYQRKDEIEKIALNMQMEAAKTKLPASKNKQKTKDDDLVL